MDLKKKAWMFSTQNSGFLFMGLYFVTFSFGLKLYSLRENIYQNQMLYVEENSQTLSTNGHILFQTL